MGSAPQDLESKTANIAALVAPREVADGQEGAATIINSRVGSRGCVCRRVYDCRKSIADDADTDKDT